VTRRLFVGVPDPRHPGDENGPVSELKQRTCLQKESLQAMLHHDARNIAAYSLMDVKEDKRRRQRPKTYNIKVEAQGIIMSDSF
jgi:hypothetical protein